ncbi:MAG: glycine cleavage T C-terminal barrel domain-containing protein, partial [Acidimicrobiales bacterium]
AGGAGAGAAGAGGAGAGLAVPAWWPGVEGIDLLGEAPAVPEGARVCGRDALEAVRVEAGVPAMGAELTEKTIPAEAGVVGSSVSFTKGCYTGQELVARLDARGNRVPKRLLGVVVATGHLDSLGGPGDLGDVGGPGEGGDPGAGSDLGGGGLPPVGSELVVAASGKVVGTLTSVAFSPGLEAAVALAYVRREVDAPADLGLSWDGVTVPASVRELPLR